MIFPYKGVYLIVKKDVFINKTLEKFIYLIINLDLNTRKIISSEVNFIEYDFFFFMLN